MRHALISNFSTKKNGFRLFSCKKLEPKTFFFLIATVPTFWGGDKSLGIRVVFVLQYSKESTSNCESSHGRGWCFWLKCSRSVELLTLGTPGSCDDFTSTTSYQKLPFGSGDYPDKLLFHQALN